MAVDYGVKSTKPVEAKVEPTVTVLAPPVSTVNVESIFLALLTAQTVASGGVKYWGNPKNTQTNITLLKQRAQNILDAYVFAE